MHAKLVEDAQIFDDAVAELNVELQKVAVAAQTAPPQTAVAAPQAQALAGLWKAERRFGPDIRGPLHFCLL